MPRDHTHQTEIENCDPARVFAALLTPSDIRNYWSASQAIIIPKSGGTWAVTWGENEDQPDYITSAQISKFEPDRILKLSKFVYQSPEGDLPFDHDLETEFQIEPTPNGSRLTVLQTGFPDDPSADEFFEGCEKGWQDTLSAMKKY